MSRKRYVVLKPYNHHGHGLNKGNVLKSSTFPQETLDYLMELGVIREIGKKSRKKGEQDDTKS